jgi:PPK2 family polyphosphate:nucleotide phosphotransferase
MKMKINSKDFGVGEGEKVKLKKWPTRVKPVYQSKEQYQELLAEQVAELSELQQLHYASNRYAVLLIFQAMDAAGKDGAIKHVMSGVSPQGCQVFVFKHPSATELEHDFLWRTSQCLPERGRIGIFNRSYYEEVLIVRVHPEILRGQGLPEELADEKTIWQERYRSIVDLENHLYRNGTRIIKFFLHLSKEEQRKRFLARIDEPEKNWKCSLPILKRGNSGNSTCMPMRLPERNEHENCALVRGPRRRQGERPADCFKMHYPKTDAKRRQELLSIRKRLAKHDCCNNEPRGV